MTQGDTTTWIVPCNASANVSFVFANQEFFVHPLDLTIPSVNLVPLADGTKENRTVCINTFQNFDFGSNFGGFDLILGEAFLRNVYASFNLGDNESGPFVQMVSTTPDLSAAYQEFQSQRAALLAQLPPTIDPSEVSQLAQGLPLPTQTEGLPSAPTAPTSVQPNPSQAISSVSPKKSNAGSAQATLPMGTGILCIAALVYGLL
ncbi:hypothetical protein NUW54_g8830 [Trametes sanguinea]|uniref:Uncharacterized protein n=1 Tax=Trametes sanguinea TaxID=158606 RepID=A0ACC1PC19_9APHY|nr:hypothetical protein NUW54_g8830 [Trametes sanguinea]